MSVNIKAFYIKLDKQNGCNNELPELDIPELGLMEGYYNNVLTANEATASQMRPL